MEFVLANDGTRPSASKVLTHLTTTDFAVVRWAVQPDCSGKRARPAAREETDSRTDRSSPGIHPRAWRSLPAGCPPVHRACRAPNREHPTGAAFATPR